MIVGYWTWLLVIAIGAPVVFVIIRFLLMAHSDSVGRDILEQREVEANNAERDRKRAEFIAQIRSLKADD